MGEETRKIIKEEIKTKIKPEIEIKRKKQKLNSRYFCKKYNIKILN